jgi:Predicted membrane protein (DUF2306)
MSDIPADVRGIKFPPLTRRSWPVPRRIGWAVVTVTSILVGAYAVFLVATGFAFVPEQVAANRFPTAIGLRTHIMASAIALLTGPFQFLRPLRRRFPMVHRTLGRIYLSACIIGGLAGGSIALFTTSGLLAGFGFLSLASAWLFSTVWAWRAVRRRDYLTHERWMTRSFALAFAAVTLRIYIPISQIAGLDYTDSYRVIAWLCWVPNLAVAQLLIRSARGEADF